MANKNQYTLTETVTVSPESIFLSPCIARMMSVAFRWWLPPGNAEERQANLSHQLRD